MDNINIYLFDFDGTLVNSQKSLTRVFQKSYEEVGVKITHEDTLYLMRVRLQEGYKYFQAPEDQTSWQRFAAAIIRELDAPETLELTETFDEVVEVLASLKAKGNILGIVTSNSKKHVLDVLNFLHIDPSLFSVIVGNKEVKEHKPNAEPVDYAVKCLKANKENVAYVGDGLDDMRCAKNAKVTPILLDRLNEYQQKDIKLIKNLKELL